jgi:ribonuclease/clavin/mitogillin
MSKIIDAVSIVMTCGNEIFAIQRQNYLKAFPGYWAFPGGKVEKEDAQFVIDDPRLHKLDPRLISALNREGQEELGVDLLEQVKQGNVSQIHCLGCAITPDFNPYRFATYFFKVDFKKKIQFKVDQNEALQAFWINNTDLLARYNKGEILAVPPVIKVIEALGKNPELTAISDLNFEYDSSRYVPYIESIKSVRQIMPLSHTLPPATRTNAFLLGDGDHPKILVDPSPKIEEYEKFKNTINLFGFDKIMLTHHHPDHHENSTQLAKDFNIPILLSLDTFNRLINIDQNYFKEIRTEIIKEGDVLTRWLGKDIVVYEVPGHDEGQLALAPVDMSWFLAGDLFQGVGTVVIGGDEGDMAKYFQTLEKVILLNPKVVFPSHGIGLGGTDIIQRTLEHRRVRENQVLTLFQEGKSEDEMLAVIYTEIPEELKPFAMKNIMKHLDKLRADGKI